ncbi:heavy-metal-associated domain-containing protein [Psychrobacter lutiphocae]|uniref:heavy-metal-associated domain-containing protein n=1 Tax=Psychrobacter lutiphocae TaxID=540500 RepID=UPI00037F15BC|nr:heavy metal-associated domain-containing protein [Psychrobacter lutiphocae]
MSNVTQIINIEGMTCGGCVKSVDNVVSQLGGVKNIDVDLEGNKATVIFDTQATSVDAIVEAIEDAGFDASVADS